MRAVLIPAAGASTRMRGDDKLLQDVDGQPCLRALVDRAARSAGTVIVTLPDLNHPRAHVLDGSGAQLIAVPDAASGMSASLKAGARAVPEQAGGLMIVPADMPSIEAQDMAAMWDRFEAGAPMILRAVTPDGAAGHPVIFAAALLPEFADLDGDHGAQRIVAAHSANIESFAFCDDRARADLDTPEDWAAWRAARVT